MGEKEVIVETKAEKIIDELEKEISAELKKLGEVSDELKTIESKLSDIRKKLEEVL